MNLRFFNQKPIRSIIAALLVVVGWWVFGAVLIATNLIVTLPAQDVNLMSPAMQAENLRHAQTSDLFMIIWLVGLALIAVVGTYVIIKNVIHLIKKK